MNWHYLQPVTIHFGNGMIACLKDEIRRLGRNRGILITSPSLEKSGLAARLVADNENTLQTVYSRVSPNPDVSECDACAGLIRQNGCDFVLAVGGGSVLDCAKAAAAFCTADAPASDYLEKKRPLPDARLPLIAVPTTAGTGSEITRVSVLSDHKKGLKAPLNTPAFYPDTAIVDPELTYTVPKHVTACTGMDVLCHAIEAYWNVHHQPVCDALAIHAARLVFRHLETACEEPENALAREKMAEASVTAGLAFALPGTTAAHACSYPLTRDLGIPHGEACGLTIDHFMRINAEKDADGRLHELALATGFDNACSMADAISELKHRTGLKTGLAGYELTDGQLEKLVQASLHPNLQNNPVPITEAMLRELYRSLR